MPADLAFTRYAKPAPTPYLKTLSSALERREPAFWARFMSEDSRREAADTLRLELLKSAYRLDVDTHAEHCAAAAEIAQAMSITAPTVLYQAEHGRFAASGRNAQLFYEPDVVHVVFSGDALATLTPAELQFVLGHEMAHHHLWSLDGGRYWAASRFLEWAASEPGRAECWVETARLARLHTELFADRFGLWAVGDLDPALSAQIKLATGLDEVSGAAYLAQAEEALLAQETTGEETRMEGESHPEGYLRAVLLAAWAHEPASAETRARSLIHGSMPLQRLDILAQEHVSEITAWLLAEFLVEPWRNREAIRAHARAISPTLADALERPQVEVDGESDRLRAAVVASHSTVREYFAYLLLDFATVDQRLDDVMLAVALVFAEDFGLSDQFRAIASRELKTSRTKLADIERNADALITRAALSLSRPDDVDSGPSRRRVATGAA